MPYILVPWRHFNFSSLTSALKILSVFDFCAFRSSTLSCIIGFYALSSRVFQSLLVTRTYNYTEFWVLMRWIPGEVFEFTSTNTVNPNKEINWLCS